MMTHSCPIHGRYDITQTECPICEKLERDSRILGQREAVASVLTLLLSSGCVPDHICHEGECIGDDAPDNLKELVDAVFAAEVCTIVWTRLDEVEPGKKNPDGSAYKELYYIGKTTFTPYEQPGHVLCDYVGWPENSGCRRFVFSLRKWSNYNGYE